mmetsp:Transcript_105129/g.322297  ORF Transcript_105129/g.322297 Transcript_105129/m.322297 type:complete len:373 (+) Transcript_105129:261-1379(+)
MHRFRHHPSDIDVLVGFAPRRVVQRAVGCGPAQGCRRADFPRPRPGAVPRHPRLVGRCLPQRADGGAARSGGCRPGRRHVGLRGVELVIPLRAVRPGPRHRPGQRVFRRRHRAPRSAHARSAGHGRHRADAAAGRAFAPHGHRRRRATHVHAAAPRLPRWLRGRRLPRELQRLVSHGDCREERPRRRLRRLRGVRGVGQPEPVRAQRGRVLVLLGGPWGAIALQAPSPPEPEPQSRAVLQRGLRADLRLRPRPADRERHWPQRDCQHESGEHILLAERALAREVGESGRPPDRRDRGLGGARRRAEAELGLAAGRGGDRRWAVPPGCGRVAEGEVLDGCRLCRRYGEQGSLERVEKQAGQFRKGRELPPGVP